MPLIAYYGMDWRCGRKTRATGIDEFGGNEWINNL
jgi:hypothetical protein